MDDTMVELVELRSGSLGKGKEKSKEKTTGRVGRARGCSWAAHLIVR
jgi:hypothetical protein